MIFPFTFIMIVDRLGVQRRSTPTEAFFARPATARQWIEPLAAVAFFVGLAVNLWIPDLVPAGFIQQVPIPFLGALISAVLYATLAVRSRPATERSTVAAEARSD